jgi:hypothetical protein
VAFPRSDPLRVSDVDPMGESSMASSAENTANTMAATDVQR